MSYDLAVFDPTALPPDRESFRYWWAKQNDSPEPHESDEPMGDCPALRSWFLEIIGTFPPMNGPFAADELPEDESLATDYGSVKL
jgi:hypothetical protein